MNLKIGLKSGSVIEVPDVDIYIYKKVGDILKNHKKKEKVIFFSNGSCVVISEIELLSLNMEEVRPDTRGMIKNDPSKIKQLQEEMDNKIARIQDKFANSLVGLKIKDLSLGENSIDMTFENDISAQIVDRQQFCCESRYITCDDDLSQFVGAEYLGYEVLNGPSQSADDSDGMHECQFVVVKTSAGTFRLTTHNEHNGYYGGFDVCLKQVLN